ncbi:hypothetical protein HAX54_035269, partial [Datura stramonium]|nr:hypothetical protein [Datura stramonium]
EYLGLTGVKLRGKEVVAAGLVTHFVPSHIREGRRQTLYECLRREFRITINTLRAIISDDFYEGIRATIIDKDKSPKWTPSTLDKVHDQQLNLMFKPFEEHNLELQIPVKEEES